MAHKIIKLTKTDFLNKCSDKIFEEFRRSGFSRVNNLEDIHESVDQGSINSLRVKAFESINNIDWKKYICELFEEVILEMCGPDFVIQKKLNLSIVMPGDKSSTLPGHSDCWSGDSPFQVNLWIPLTRVFETNGMFILPEDKSFDIFKKISNDSKVIQDDIPDSKYFLKTEPGNAVVFNPTLFHGSVENKTNITRVSLNVRIKNLFAPDFSDACPDRSQASYYDVGKISDHSRLALKYMELIKR